LPQTKHGLLNGLKVCREVHRVSWLCLLCNIFVYLLVKASIEPLKLC